MGAGSCLICAALGTDDRALKHADILQIQRICASLVGQDYGRVAASNPLKRYFATEHPAIVVVCGGGACGCSIPLRGALSVQLAFNYCGGSVGALEHGCWIFSVDLRRAGTTIAHYGHPPKT
jgi:hypothetical protein